MYRQMNKEKRSTLKTKRCERGIGGAEVAISAFLMVALAALTADATLLFLAFTINDACARDCARAAGMVPSSQEKETLGQAQANAQAAAENQLQVHSTDGHLITGLNGESHPTLLTGANQFTYDTNGWPPLQTLVNGSASAPYVTCTTAVLVKIPVNIPFFGAVGNVTPTNQLLMKRTYSFPIVTTELAN